MFLLISQQCRTSKPPPKEHFYRNCLAAPESGSPGLHSSVALSVLFWLGSLSARQKLSPRPPARSLAQAEWKRALFPQRLVFLSPSLPAFVCELHEMISMTNRLSACLHFCNNPPDGFQPAWYILENVRSPV